MRKGCHQRVFNALSRHITVFHRIPFIERDHQSAAFAFRQAGNAQILFIHAKQRIQDKHHHFRFLECGQAGSDRHLLQRFLHPRLLAHAGSINQPHFTAG